MPTNHGKRVAWRCTTVGCPLPVHEGTVWVADAKLKLGGDDDYNIAAKMGLVTDPRPPGVVHYALVAFDDAPGVLAVRPWTQLVVLR